MNKPVTLLFIAIGILLMASRCDHSAISVKDIPVTDFYDSCTTDTYIEFGKLITLADHAERFFISLPYSWDIRESYSDSLYGIFGSNFLSIPKPDDEKMSLGIAGYATDKSLKDYYYDELKVLINDAQTEVIETGKTNHNGEEAYWVRFNNSYRDKAIFQFVLYLKKHDSPEIYLVQSTAYSADKHNYILCNLKRLMSTTEWGE